MKTQDLSKLAAVLLLSVAAFSSCKKDVNGVTPGSANNNSQLVLGVKSDNTVTTFSTAGANVGVNDNSGRSANVTFTSGIANITNFKLEAKKNGVEREITTTNLTNVDLFAITPATVSALIDTGTYREIEVRVNLTKSTTGVLPLLLKGSFTTVGGAVVPFELNYNDDATVKIESSENIVVDGVSNITNNLTFHLSKLLNGVSSAELDAATRTGGTILVSSTVNTSIYNKIKANLSTSGGSGGFEHHGKN